jgi:iron complex outermembrane recepter protein
MNRLLILVAASALPMAMNVAVAQEKPAGSSDSSAAPMAEVSEIIITGTRRQDRTVAESSAPIDVLSGAELSVQPAANMMDILSNTVPSFNVGQNTISDASSFVRAPSLRGLPGDEILVMLNGKRFNRSALVQTYQGGETELSFGSQGPDLSSIPSIAIKSLEILRDGASAQYGSDAIAGVLNYQFRDNPSGLELSARYGKYFPSGYSSDGADGQVGANLGLPLGGQGFVNLSLEVFKYNQTVRNPTRPSALEFAKKFPNLAAGLPHYPGPVQEWGTPPSKGYKAIINSGLRLDNGDQIYFFANYAHIETDESFNYRLPVSFTGASGAHYSSHPAFNDFYLTPCPPGNPTCPAGGFINDTNTYNYNTSVYPSGFTPRFYGTTQELFGTVGYKGTNSHGMTYDMSGTLAQNYLDMSLRSSLNFSLGPNTPTNFYIGKFQQQEADLNLDVTYPWKVAAFASPITVAAGLEWRNESFQQFLGDPASYASGVFVSQPLYDCVANVCTKHLDPASTTGAQLIIGHSAASNGFGGVSTGVDAAQRSYAGYVDLESDVTSNLTLGVAGRYEDYAAFGSTTVGKFQARLKVNDSVALRATASTGFHAPSPGQSNVETLTTNFVNGINVQQGTYRISSPAARYYRSTSLGPEKSTNLSAGIVLTPVAGLLITLDGYSIEVKDRISISPAFKVTQVDIDNLADLQYVGVGGVVQYFANGFDTKTKGVDLVGSYTFHVGAGRLQSTLAYNYNKSEVTYVKNIATPTATNPNKVTPLIDATRTLDIEHFAPNNRANLNLDYSIGQIRASLRENYYGTWRDEADYKGQLFSAKTTTEVEFSYLFPNRITGSIGGRNIFNAVPDVIVYDQSGKLTISPLTGGAGDGQHYPRSGGPFGFNGAFWYVRVGVTF